MQARRRGDAPRMCRPTRCRDSVRRARGRRAVRDRSGQAAGLGLELSDHVVGPGVVAQPFLVADDLLAVGPLKGQASGRLAVVGLDPQADAIPGGRLLLDRDAVATGLVLEGVELVGGDGEDELARQPARLALAELV